MNELKKMRPDFPDQFYWFRAVAKFWNEARTLENVLLADVHLARLPTRTAPGGRGN